MPGAWQVFGDRLALALGTSEAAQVVFLTLSGLGQGGAPRLIADRQVLLSRTPVALGITDVGDGGQRSYVLAARDSVGLTVFVSNERSIDQPGSMFTKRFDTTVTGPLPTAMSLLTDRSGAVFMVSLVAADGAQKVLLHRIDVTAKTVTPLPDSTRTFTPSAAGISFSAGAGIELVGPRALQLFAAAGQAVGGRLAYDVFRP